MAREYEWVPARGRHLKKGDVLRTPKDEDNLEGPQLYSVCSGGGFGCNPAAMGSAIFVDNESHSLEDTLTGVTNRKARWEKYWTLFLRVEAEAAQA